MTIPESFGPLGARLYHYTKLATALEDIVPNQTLKLGPFSSMRDPRESQDWAIMTAGFGELALEDFVPPSVELNRTISDLKSHVKVLSLTHDDPKGDEPFGRGFAHPRLWEQYADNHRGVCLCFDTDSLTDLLTARLDAHGEADHDDVSYVDAEIAPQARTVIFDEVSKNGVTETAIQHVRRHLHELFFTKLTDWATEMEHRFAVVTDHPDPIYVDVKPALRAVILGADVSRQYEPAFAAVCNPSGVEIRYMRWVHGRPHLAPR